MTQKLDLPDDSVKDVTQLLDYLYSGVFRPLNVNDWERLIDETTDMYILADKYLIKGLKEAIVKELRAIGNTVNRPDLLFSSARKIYDHVFNSDDPFPTFFRENVTTIMSWEKLEPNTWKLILNIFSEGGKLAEDIFQAQRSTLLETQKKHEKLAGRTYCWKCTRPTIVKQKSPQSEPELIHVLD